MTSTKKKPVPKCNQSSKWKRGVRERIAAQQKQNSKKKATKNSKPQVRIPIVRDRSVQFDVITSSDSY